MQGIYSGWRVVAVSVVVYMLVVGAVFSAFGLFVLPVSAEFGLSRANMNSGLILINLGSAALAPFIGRALDRRSVRAVMIGSAMLMGLCLIALGLSRSLWVSAAVLATALPAASLGAGTITMSVLIARWFVARRGRAMALASIGMFAGSIVVVPIVSFLIESHGWRTALVIMGIAVSGLLLAMSLAIRVQPSAHDLAREMGQGVAPVRSSGGTPVAGPAKMGALLRMPQLWSICVSTALIFAISQAVLISLVPLGRDAGLLAMQAASLVSIMGAGAVAGALTIAVVADRVDRMLLLTALFVMGGVVNVALLLSDSFALLTVCAAVLGMTNGALAPVFYALLADRFGAASFGTVRGLSIPMTGVASMVAIRFVGEVFDRTGGYKVAFGVFVVIQLLAAALMFATRYSSAPAVQPAAARAS